MTMPAEAGRPHRCCMSDPNALLERRFRVLGHRATLFYDPPLHIVRGEGVWLIAADGRRYLDAYNNVPHVGHCHPRVVDAIHKQSSTLNIHSRYLDEVMVRYLERLTAKFDPALSMAALCCSGSEANELALRIARQCTGGRGVLVTDFSYHGNTAALSEISTAYIGAARPGKYVRTFHAPDPYRDRQGRDDASLAKIYASEVKRQIEAFAEDEVKFAALVLCTALSSEGLPELPRGFMAQAIEYVHDAGGVFIADEVQAGFGRFGEWMWGHELLDVRPDIVTLGKPMGNGHPLAGVISTSELIERFSRETMYFGTFAGNPVSCAAGMAVLDVLEDEGLLTNATIVGHYLIRGLRELQSKHTVIGDVRGKGLFIGVELVKDRQSKAPSRDLVREVLNSMRRDGVLIGSTAPGHNVLKIRPPMPFSKANADQLVDALDKVLSAL